mgnify:CR=1 FL=1
MRVFRLKEIDLLYAAILILVLDMGVSLSSEQDYYERVEFWEADKYQRDFEQDRLLACLELIPSSVSKLLDVGAGNGVFLSMVEAERPEVVCYGVDRSGAAINCAVCRSAISLGEITSLPYSDKEFDVVSALDVIEHISFESYETALLELGRVSSKYILLNVPYRENRLLATCSYCGCRFNPHFHMRSFSENVLFNLFPGFTVVSSKRVMRSVSIAEAILNPFRKSVFGGFPSYCVCPQCGFSEDVRAEKGNINLNQKVNSRQRIKNILRKLPSVKVPSEIVVVYRRDGLS